jgi:hypothetical protein
MGRQKGRKISENRLFCLIQSLDLGLRGVSVLGWALTGTGTGEISCCGSDPEPRMGFAWSRAVPLLLRF